MNSSAAASAFSDLSGHTCSSVTLNPSRLVAMIRTVDEAVTTAYDQLGGSVEDVLAVVDLGKRTRPSRAAATDSAAPMPGC